MARPRKFELGGTVYWIIRIYDTDFTLKDADSDPTVNVYRDGADTADSVTVTKRTSTTGIYDCSYNPALETLGEMFSMEETVVIDGVTYEHQWEMTCQDSDAGGAATTILPQINAAYFGMMV